MNVPEYCQTLARWLFPIFHSLVAIETVHQCLDRFLLPFTAAVPTLIGLSYDLSRSFTIREDWMEMGKRREDGS